MHEPLLQKTRHQPGATFQSTAGVRYRADVHGTLRRIDSPPQRVTKREKKALKRARIRERHLGRNVA
ncbi:MAG TPA: hypothetical protein VJV75_11530 [Candidatus Polarisedimenticolia bacterium]|nr:hypothetical protein [Candidatus Polarisedimenticolia bacterium]